MFYLYIGIVVMVIAMIIGFGIWVVCNIDYLLQWADDIEKREIKPRYWVTNIFFENEVNEFHNCMFGESCVFWWLGMPLMALWILSLILGILWPLSISAIFFFLLREWKRFKKKLEKLAEANKNKIEEEKE